MSNFFRKFANFVSSAAGTPIAFLLAISVIVAWAVTGPIFDFSDTWQLIINTGTTIVTFLMVFLIQNTQNRDSQAIHAKLDDLILNLRDADNSIMRAEDMTEDELHELKHRFQELANKAEGHAANKRGSGNPGDPNGEHEDNGQTARRAPEANGKSNSKR